MDVRGSLLALLTLGPCHGAQLASELATRTGEPVNAGQVAKTLVRLERDGAVVALPRDTAGRIPYRLTESGTPEAVAWLAEPGIDFGRFELAASLPEVDVAALLAHARATLDRVEATLGSIEPRGLAAPPRRGRPRRISAPE